MTHKWGWLGGGPTKQSTHLIFWGRARKTYSKSFSYLRFWPKGVQGPPETRIFLSFHFIIISNVYKGRSSIWKIRKLVRILWPLVGTLWPLLRMRTCSRGCLTISGDVHAFLPWRQMHEAKAEKRGRRPGIFRQPLPVRILTSGHSTPTSGHTF